MELLNILDRRMIPVHWLDSHLMFYLKKNYKWLNLDKKMKILKIM